MLRRILQLSVLSCLLSCYGDQLEVSFQTPESNYRPETWFHLIGGNVNREALTVDLEAVSRGQFQGIHLFHGSGREWPGVQPQVQCLSPEWDGLIESIGRETERLNLGFIMQNCPGWAMSGGPWITPDRAMRHLIWSRTDVVSDGQQSLNLALPTPQPSDEDWRDYRDVMVLAFPTPEGDVPGFLKPTIVGSNRPDIPWYDVFADGLSEGVKVPSDEGPIWVEVEFDQPLILRNIVVPPTEHIADRISFDPGIQVILEAVHGTTRSIVGKRDIPRGNWQDRLPEYGISLAYSDHESKRYRITFEHKHTIVFTSLRLVSGARTNDWMGQAGYVLRSMERREALQQDADAWVKLESIVDVSEDLKTDGELETVLPKGNWTIVRYGHVNTGVKNKPAPPEATGFECNKLSTSGADQHFDGYIGRLSTNGGVIEGVLDGVLIDSWECYTQTWTAAMEAEFSKRRGYGLRQWLPALSGWVVEDHSSSERFLRDWRATISDMLVENYFGRMAELSHKNGLTITFETALGDVSPGDILQHYGKADIPMCELWQPNDPHWGGLETKPIEPTVSSGRLYGKSKVAAEAFTQVGIQWNEHPYMLKNQADRHLAMGINHFVFHTYTHNPRLDLVPGTSFGNRIGSPFLRGQTWWNYVPLFTDYLSRCHVLLQNGKPVTDVLWYLGDDVDHKPRQDSPFPQGYQYDYLNQDALLNRLQVRNGRLATADGIEWKVIWLSPEQCERLTPATLRRLKLLIEAGACVIGSAPKVNPSLEGGAEADADFVRLKAELWGESIAQSGDRKLGKGRLLWGGDLRTNLQRLGILPDFVGDETLNWCHRISDDGEREIYFVSTDRDDPLRGNVKFRAKGKPSFWDPITGEKRPVRVYQEQGDYTSVALEMNAADSVFVVFETSADDSSAAIRRISRVDEVLYDSGEAPVDIDGVPYPAFGLTPEDETQPWVDPFVPVVEFVGSDAIFWEDGSYSIETADESVYTVDAVGCRVIPLVKQWTLTFEQGWDTLGTVEMEKLAAWSELEHLASKMYSGTATYSKTLSLEKPSEKQELMLDLGRVENIAEVWVNGKKVGVKWAPPFRFDITDFVTGEGDLLEVKVTNTWRNRLILDQRNAEAERKTWTIHAPPADAEVSPAGLVTDVFVRVGVREKIRSERISLSVRMIRKPSIAFNF